MLLPIWILKVIIWTDKVVDFQTGIFLITLYTNILDTHL